MKIELIGFDFELNPNDKMDILVDAVNASDADLILFPERTIRDLNDLLYVEQDIKNKSTVAILELEESLATSCMFQRNSLFMLHGGLFFDLYTSKIFDTDEDIDGNDALMDKLLDEMKRRQFACCGNRITVLQGGETSLLAGAGLKLDFRFSGNAVLNRRFQNLLAGTDIFLNPFNDATDGHSHVQRLAALSADGRWCLSTGMLGRDKMGNFSDKGLQHIFHDGREIQVRPKINEEEGYVSRTIEVPDRIAPWPSATPS